MMSCEHVVCTNCLLAAIEGHKDITCYVCGILIPPSTHIEAYPKDMKIIRSLKERKRSDDIGAKILNLSDAILSDKDPSKNIM